MRRSGPVALVVAVLLLASSPGAGAQTPDEDFTTGFGRSVVLDFDFAARSGPSGESPTGHFSADVLDDHLEGPVSCLNVIGKTATLVFTHDNPNFGPFALVTVVDNGPQGVDTIAGFTSSLPVDCSTPTTILQEPLLDGDIVVHDAPAERVLFGKTTVGSAFGLLDHNDKYGSRYYLFTASPVSVTKLRAYLDGLGRRSGSQIVRGLIYRHTATGPGVLVAQSAAVTIRAGQPASWVGLDFPSPPSLLAGGYWLTLHAGESENVVRYAFDPKTGGQRRNDDLFSNGPLNPFGGSDKAAREMAIHAVGH